MRHMFSRKLRKTEIEKIVRAKQNTKRLHGRAAINKKVELPDGPVAVPPKRVV
jgi:hypothetical protein